MRYWINMITHFREFGGIWEKTAGNVVEELEHFNAWGAYENREGWHDVTLYDLRDAHRRRIQEVEADKCKAGRDFHREELYFGELINGAISTEEETARVVRLGAKAMQAGVGGRLLGVTPLPPKTLVVSIVFVFLTQLNCVTPNYIEDLILMNGEGVAEV